MKNLRLAISQVDRGLCTAMLQMCGVYLFAAASAEAWRSSYACMSHWTNRATLLIVCNLFRILPLILDLRDRLKSALFASG